MIPFIQQHKKKTKNFTEKEIKKEEHRSLIFFVFRLHLSVIVHAATAADADAVAASSSINQIIYQNCFFPSLFLDDQANVIVVRYFLNFVDRQHKIDSFYLLLSLPFYFRNCSSGTVIVHTCWLLHEILSSGCCVRSIFKIWILVAAVECILELSVCVDNVLFILIHNFFLFSIPVKNHKRLK